MPKKLILFPDTNLFIQCKPLREIDWSSYGDFEEIDLIVSRPVQVEIDRQKSKGIGRLGNRARAAASQFGGVLDAAEGFVVISHGRPIVRMLLKLEYRVDLDLADRLNYEERDDQLVGITAAFAKNNPDSDVRVITLDVGPRASARAVGVNCETIRADWCLPPEADESEKRFKSMQNELAQYKNAEPAFELVSINLGVNPQIFEATLIRYPALDDNQLLSLMQRVKSNFPEATDFGPKNSEDARSDTSKGAFGALSILNSFNKEFVPASEMDISKYKQTLYPKWLSESWDFLRDLHLHLHDQSGWPCLEIKLRNVGTRPAENTLITLSALGKFRIKPPSPKEDEKLKEKLNIKRPPKAPAGLWRERYISALVAFNRSNVESNSISVFANQGRLLNLKPQKRDDEGFYYKPSLPDSMVKEFSLECVRWRHQLQPESFKTEIWIKLEDGVFEGAVDVTVHASNMMIQFNKQVPFRIEVCQGDTLKEANRLVDKLLKPVAYRINMPDSE